MCPIIQFILSPRDLKEPPMNHYTDHLLATIERRMTKFAYISLDFPDFMTVRLDRTHPVDGHHEIGVGITDTTARLHAVIWVRPEKPSSLSTRSGLTSYRITLPSIGVLDEDDDSFLFVPNNASVVTNCWTEIDTYLVEQIFSTCGHGDLTPSAITTRIGREFLDRATRILTENNASEEVIKNVTLDRYNNPTRFVLLSDDEEFASIKVKRNNPFESMIQVNVSDENLTFVCIDSDDPFADFTEQIEDYLARQILDTHADFFGLS